jgi:hypothetical protein
MAKIKTYEPIQMNVDERIKFVNEGYELWLGIEGRYTNLRIWKSRLHAKVNPENTEGIFMRLDKANSYSAPVNENNLGYIQDEKSVVHKLAKFEFPTSVENLNEIIEITKSLKIRRDIVEW